MMHNIPGISMQGQGIWRMRFSLVFQTKARIIPQNMP